MQRPWVSEEQGSFREVQRVRRVGGRGVEEEREWRRQQRPGFLCTVHAFGYIISCRHWGATEVY